MRRNREFERLGVVPPVQQASINRQRSVVEMSGNKKSKVVSNCHAQTSQDDKSSSSVTDIDEASTSETDVDKSLMSEKDGDDDDDDTEEVVSDTDNEVIIVSEVKGNDSGLKTTQKKSSSDQGSRTKADTDGCVRLKKPQTQFAAGETSSSRWMQRVKMLEATMSEMKTKFAEVLRHKVSDACVLCTTKTD